MKLIINPNLFFQQFAQLNMEIAKKNAMISQLSAENLALKDENAILMQKLNALQHEVC